MGGIPLKIIYPRLNFKKRNEINNIVFKLYLFV